MISNIKELESEILKRKLAEKNDLIGCNDQEINLVEDQYGQLPLFYKQIMKLMGCSAGKHFLAYENDFTFERAINLNKWMMQDRYLTKEVKLVAKGKLDNIFFMSGIYAEYCGGIGFIKTGENLLDSPVYYMDMAYENSVDINEWINTIEITDISIWKWIENIVDIAEQKMSKEKIEAGRTLWQKMFR
jgi:hypothetical protein